MGFPLVPYDIKRARLKSGDVDALEAFEFDVEGVASVEGGLAGEAFGGRNDDALFVAEDGSR